MPILDDNTGDRPYDLDIFDKLAGISPDTLRAPEADGIFRLAERRGPEVVEALHIALTPLLERVAAQPTESSARMLGNQVVRWMASMRYHEIEVASGHVDVTASDDEVPLTFDELIQFLHSLEPDNETDINDEQIGDV